MKPRTEEQDYGAWLAALGPLDDKGWKHVGPLRWDFRSPCGSVHDLSAADLDQLDRIESEGHFLVGVGDD